MEAEAAGLCVIPPSEDGQKRPKPGLPKIRPDDPSPFLWDEYKTRLPTKDETQRWYPGCSGLGLVAGTVSGNVEPWDFDDRATYDAFVMAARACGLGDVIDRIEAGYCDDTAGDGVRWLVRYPEGARTEFSKDREILARRPKEPHEKKHEKDSTKILIEMTRFSILAPTNGKVHPSGKAYARRSGGFATIASYTVEERNALFDLAKSFDQMPRSKVGAHPPRTGKPTKGERPGDFNARAIWAEVLVGWKQLYTKGGITYWCRPGKKFGVSATTGVHGLDLLHVFTSSTEFDPDKNYDKFGAYTVLNHGGDFTSAVKSLGKAGYGRDTVRGAADRAERTSGGEEETTPRADIDPTIERVEYRDTGHRLEWLYRDREHPDGT
jgi:putative DNA primase/helicase